MTPTAKFRWLEIWKEKDITYDMRHPSAIPVAWTKERVRVLQQWWEDELPTIVAHGTDYVETERKGEWRDIPVEEQA